MVINFINNRKDQLKEVILVKSKGLKKSPKGSLKISKSHGIEQLYHVFWEQGVRQEKYLSKENEEVIRSLAQKRYDMTVLKLAEQELRAWEMLEKLLPGMTAEEVYETLSPLRQKYVTPIRQTDEEYRKQWEAVNYEPGYFRDDAPKYRTNRGEWVRSKTELLIANLLYYLGIPYRYEYPVAIYVGGVKQIWRPDFMLLDVKNRKEYFLEHFGMLDDQSEDNYARNAFRKMRIYEENGMYEGKNMIYSFETSRAQYDSDYLELKLRRIFGIRVAIAGR